MTTFVVLIAKLAKFANKFSMKLAYFKSTWWQLWKEGSSVFRLPLANLFGVWELTKIVFTSVMKMVNRQRYSYVCL